MLEWLCKVSTGETVNESVDVRILQESVEKGGGVWVGLQDTFIAGQEPLVLFNAPTSKTTLALPVSRCCTKNVQDKINSSKVVFEKPPVRVSITTIEELYSLATELSRRLSDILHKF